MRPSTLGGEARYNGARRQWQAGELTTIAAYAYIAALRPKASDFHSRQRVDRIRSHARVQGDEEESHSEA